ncbi:metalloregulator ArsR/SmtB family transcription factor [Iodobacter sp. LRB]|uniref:ArsR/SmtB family transcription factor n=1 Tax=unclassified Iodobacter TaxID=235634 RepID=UPI000C0D1746|nr:metalloregulator ArsR/SmtB family transcription factor [Iodobacter sp. BJB302]PHV00102.1 ArsR family transcriptional regulator [Iodobacter sp. BJB302]
MSISEAASKYQLFSEQADLAKTLGNSHRLFLLELITKGEKAVDQLAELSGLSIANTSQHLQHLKRSSFVYSRRDGKNVLYRIGSSPVLSLLAALSACAEHNRAEIRALISDTFDQKDKLEAISREELLARMHDASMVLLDVRTEEEFSQGHLPGAINIPLDELERRLTELPQDQDIVAYCRGTYCALSGKAVALLRTKGWNARHLTGGFID